MVWETLSMFGVLMRCLKREREREMIPEVLHRNEHLLELGFDHRAQTWVPNVYPDLYRWHWAWNDVGNVGDSTSPRWHPRKRFVSLECSSFLFHILSWSRWKSDATNGSICFFWRRINVRNHVEPNRIVPEEKAKFSSLNNRNSPPTSAAT